MTDPHVLAPNDEVEVRFPFYPDLNDRVLVGPDGRLSLQLVNTVAVGGLSVADATKLINERYASVIQDPQATITLRTYAPQEVFVDGWVSNPGLVRSDVPLTVSRALAQAGGAKSGAHTDGILVLRRASDGKIYYYQVTLGNYAGAGGEDPLLKSYDVVVCSADRVCLAHRTFSPTTSSKSRFTSVHGAIANATFCRCRASRGQIAWPLIPTS